MEEEIKQKEELDKKILFFKLKLQQRLDEEYKEKLVEDSEKEKIEGFEEVFETEISSIKYYDEFFLKTKFKELLGLNEVYIVELRSGEKTIYEIYLKDTNHKIAYIDVDEKIEFINELIDSDVTIQEIEKMNEENEIEYFEEDLEKLEEEYPEVKEELEKENYQTEVLNEEEQIDEEEKKDEEILENSELNTQMLEEELGLDNGDIVSCTKVILNGKDNLFKKQVKEAKNFDRVYLVYVKSSDSFRFVGKKVGEKPRFLESVEPSKETMKQSIDIDSETGDMEYRNIKGLMKIKDSKDYDFSVKIGQYGCIELESLRKDESSNKYISTKVETTSQRPLENQKAAEKLMDKRYNKYIHDDVENFEDIKENEGSSIDVNIRDVAKGKEEQHVREELDEIDEKEGKDREKSLDENIKKYYYDE